MLKQTSKILLSEMAEQKKLKILNQTSLYAKNTKNENIDNVNTIKVDYNRMACTKIKNQPFTQCQCGALLIDEDYLSKKGVQKCMGNIKWYCRFCKKQNISKEIYFCQNGFKTVIQKNIQRGFLPPILLFLIDISGSMGQSISVQLQNPNDKQTKLMVASKQILQIIKNSFFEQKQLHKQKRYQFMEQKQTLQKNKSKVKQYFSNITLFMSIIENYMNQLKKQTQLAQFRVGFVFFNQEIYVMKPSKQKSIPIFLAKTSKFKKQFPFDKKVVDFDNYEVLFNQGKKFQRFFGDSRLKTCDMEKLMTQNLTIDGQTALGPALALGLGIVSAHDIGSRIVIVSDAVPNMGILSPDTSYFNQKVYKDINKFIELRQTTIGILNWITQNNKTYKQKINSQFGQFLKSNKERIKQITLDFSLRQGHPQILKTARKTLQNLIHRGSLGQVSSVKIFTSNPKVQATNLKYDDINFSRIKYLGLQHNSWVQLKLKKITEQDLLFPVYTQLVITYQDIFTKQKYLFMSYIMHKIISTASEKQVYQCMDESNKNNLKQLIDLQKLYKFDRDNIIPESVASRSFQVISMNSQKIQNFTDFSMNMSLNALADLQNRRYEQDDEDYDKL